MNKDQTRTNTFGVPIPDNTPMGQVEMQGRLYHGIVNHQEGRSLFVRILAILFCFVCLIGPGAFFIAISPLAYVDGGWLAVIVPVALGIIFVGGGVAGIVANVKKPKA